MTINNKEKEITEASASVGLLLATAVPDSHKLHFICSLNFKYNIYDI